VPLAGESTVAPSFACDEPASEVEARICADPTLARLDLRLDTVWTLGMEAMADGGAPAADLDLMRAEQRGWIGGRDECWKAGDVPACVRDAYRTRIARVEVSFALAPSGEPTFWSCRDDPANEFVVTFFETHPPGARVERGDRQEVLLAVPAASGSRYSGPFGTEIWLKGDEGAFVWPQTDTIPCTLRTP
jgi:uncharacterized protein